MQDFEAEYKALTGKVLPLSNLEAHNVYRTNGRKALEDAAKALGISMDEVRLPMTVIDGVVYMGDSALLNQLPKDALAMSATGTDSVVIYLYLPACESCAEAVTVVDALPTQVSLNRGNYAFESDVVVHKVDLSSASQRAYALFEAYQVPDEQRVAPIVFVGNSYLSGAEAIKQRLTPLIEQGLGIGTLMGEDTVEATAVSAWSVGGVVGAGLVGGLNPCALSMLLLFLSTLLQAGRQAGRYAIAFLAAKLICYLLIGTVLLGALQWMNPAWLLPAARWLLTLMGGALVALNLWDAYQAKAGALGRIRNQLPKGLRARLHHAIDALKSPKGRLLPLVCLLGVIIAAGEFLCAGQMYLIGLLTALQSGADFFRLFALLSLYCVAFLTPSAVLSLIVTRAGKWMAASVFLAERMAVVKLITALAMAGLVVAAWLL